MRCPSDAQAGVLALVADPPRGAECVLWGVGATDLLPAHWATLAVEVIDRDRNVGRLSYGWEWGGRWREATVRACVNAGWLDCLHEREFHWPATTVTRARSATFRELRMTEDGLIGLGLWRERKLNAPPPPAPVLAGEDRAVVALAEEARRLGYKVVPAEDQARVRARRLAREGWVVRGWAPASGRSVEPTALGSVEVAPECADRPAPQR